LASARKGTGGTVLCEYGFLPKEYEISVAGMCPLGLLSRTNGNWFSGIAQQHKSHVAITISSLRAFPQAPLGAAWCYRTGHYLHENVKQIKPKKHQRKAFSIFKYGLNYLNNTLLNPKNATNIDCFQFLSSTY